MVATAGPNWLGSPQHVVVGAILALIVYGVMRWRPVRPLLYADKFHYSAYYDTLADMASSVVGALVGAAVAVPLARRLSRDS